MAWTKFTWLENVTKAVAARFNNEEEGIQEAKEAAATASAYAKFITPVGGTSGVTGYIGPLISTAVSTEGLEEPSFLEDVEQYFDGCTPEVALKPETTYAGSTNPKKANISNWTSMWKKIGTKKRWRGHTLLWWSGLAQWMYLPAETINGKAGTWSGTEAEYRTQMLTYIKQVVEAVGTRVDCWDVLNELTNGGKLRQCAFTEICGKSLTIVKTNPVMQFYAEAIRVAKEANPAAAMFVNEYEIETTFNYGAGQRGTVFLEFINVLFELEASNPALYRAPDGIGMQFHTNTKRLVTAAEVKEVVPKYTEKELEVEITEFDCQIEPGDTEEKQGEVYEAMIEGAKKSGVGRVTIWGVTDKRSWLKTQWEAAYKLTANTAEGSGVLNLTEAEAKKLIVEATAGRQVQVQFKSVTAGCGFSTGTTYYVVASAANTFELSATEKGAAIKVTAGKTLLSSETEVFKWAGESSPYPRPCPFGWLGNIKPAWRSIERSRPEQPGVGAWVPITSMSPAKVGQKTGAAIAQARTEGLNVRFSGIAEATATIKNGETILTLPPAMHPSEAREIEIFIVISGTPVYERLVIGTNGAVTLSLGKAEAAYEPVSGNAIRLDGKTFAL